MAKTWKTGLLVQKPWKMVLTENQKSCFSGEIPTIFEGLFEKHFLTSINIFKHFGVQPPCGSPPGTGGGHVPGRVWWRGWVHNFVNSVLLLCLLVVAVCYGGRLGVCWDVNFNNLTLPFNLAHPNFIS